MKKWHVSVVFFLVFFVLMALSEAATEEKKLKRSQITIEEAYKRKAKNNVKIRFTVNHFADSTKYKKKKKETQKGRDRRTTKTNYSKHWKQTLREEMNLEE